MAEITGGDHAHRAHQPLQRLTYPSCQQPADQQPQQGEPEKHEQQDDSQGEHVVDHAVGQQTDSEISQVLAPHRPVGHGHGIAVTVGGGAHSHQVIGGDRLSNRTAERSGSV